MTKDFNVSVSMDQAAAVKTGVILKQGDFGFDLKITVLDFVVTGTTPQIVFRKAMGAVESTDVTASGNVYIYTFKGTELDVPGKVFCDLKLKNSTTQRISTASFQFEVVADTLDGLTEESDSYSDTVAQIVGGFDSDILTIDSALEFNSVQKNLCGMDTTAFYPVDLSNVEKLTFSTSDGSKLESNINLNYYNSQKGYIGASSFLNNTSQRTIDLAEIFKPAKYIRWSASNAVPLQVEVGETATQYTPYKLPIIYQVSDLQSKTAAQKINIANATKRISDLENISEFNFVQKNLCGMDTTAFYPVDLSNVEKLTFSTSDGSKLNADINLNYYDSQKVYIAASSFLHNTSQRTIELAEILKAAKYIRWGASNDVPLQVEVGETATRYTPYKLPIISQVSDLQSKTAAQEINITNATKKIADLNSATEFNFVQKNLCGMDTTAFYPVDLSNVEKLTFSTSDGSKLESNINLNYYNSQKGYIGASSFLNNTSQRTIDLAEILKAAKYIRWGASNAVPLQVEVGETATQYTPYKLPIIYQVSDLQSKTAAQETKITNATNRITSLEYTDAKDTNVYYYTGEELDLSAPNKFNVKQIMSNANVNQPSGKTGQGFAIYNGILFQFYADDYCRLYDMETGEIIASVNVTCGHGNTAVFTNSKYDADDEFPLVYITESVGLVYLTRISRSSATTIKTYSFDAATFGYHPEFALDEAGRYAYIVSNKVDSAYITTAIITKCDMTNETDNGDGTYTPEIVESYEINLQGETVVLQGVKYLNGHLYLPSGGSSASINSVINVIDTTTKSIDSFISDLPDIIKAEELEDVDFVLNSFTMKYEMVVYLRATGYYKLIF